jgi:hypothetical protein
MHALVLIGRTPAARDSPEVASMAAAILGMSADEFATRVIAAAPVTVLETADRDAVEAVRQQLVACGIDADVVQSDGIEWLVELDGVTRGPVPLAWLEAEVRAGRLDDHGRVRRTTNAHWIALASVVSGNPSRAVDASSVSRAPNGVLPPDMTEAARLFIGENHAFYLRSWGLDGSGGHAWNWPAFLFGPSWLVYRKMTRYAVGWLAFIVVVALLETRLDVSIVLSFVITLIPNLVIASTGNALYRKHFEQAIQSLSPGRDPARLRIDLAREGGTSLIAAIVFTALSVMISMNAGMLGTSIGAG